MKKQILLTIAIIASFFGMRAQNFYTPEDIEVGWYIGSLAESGIYSEGEILPLTVTPGPPVYREDEIPQITLSLQRGNKFLCLAFSFKYYYPIKSRRWFITINYISLQTLATFNHIGNTENDGIMPELEPLFNENRIDFHFDNFRYHEEENCVTIPMSVNNNPNNYLIVWLDKNNAVNALPEPAGETTYYNLDGVKVNPENTEGIVIRKSGGESEKILVK